MTTYQTIKKTLLFLTPAHIGYLKSCSSVIALYRRMKWRTAQERAECKLEGYVTCLAISGYITKIEAELLFEYYSSKNRMQEFRSLNKEYQE